MTPNSIQHYALQAHTQERMDAAARRRRASEPDGAPRRQPRLRWTFGR